jgi:hypothetical protein
MKTKNLFLSVLIAVTMTSCVQTAYYQVYKTTPTTNVTLKDNALVYDDENCKVLYNLWQEGGNIGFTLFNKTEKNIYINLEECFFISNGKAFDYYKNRVYTSSTSIGSSRGIGASASKSVTGINYLDLIQTNSASYVNSVAATTTSGKSVSYSEEKIVCIPAHTSKTIKEYEINDILFRHCDLYRFPSRNKIKTVNFTKSESPIVFSNRIEYKVGQSGNPIKFENEFYISEITNYPETEITELKLDEFCGKKEMTSSMYFKNVSPDKFYVKYSW